MLKTKYVARPQNSQALHSGTDQMKFVESVLRESIYQMRSLNTNVPKKTQTHTQSISNQFWLLLLKLKINLKKNYNRL